MSQDLGATSEGV